MRYHKLDLNLLVVFDKLLSECSVARTAEQLNLSQPAISNSLARLRRHYEDELFVPVGRGIKPTPFAESLRATVRACVADIEKIATTRPVFDPRTAETTFTIVSSDQAYVSLIAPLIRRLRQTAPGVRVHALLSSTEREELLRRGMVDFIVTLDGRVVAEHPHAELFEDELVCLTWRDNPHVSDPLTLDAFCSLGHVDTSLHPGAREVDVALAARGLSREVVAYAPTFVLIADTIVGADLIGIIGAIPARAFAERLPLRVLRPPLPLPSIKLVLQWHASRDGDAGIAWMRDALVDLAHGLG